MPRILEIRWQRLVDERGRTCPRCGSTGQEVRSAARTLSKALKPLGIGVRLHARPLSLKAFKNAPSSSNRIWVAGRPLEDWIEGNVGRSRCCGACGTSECRTLTIDDAEHEVIPAPLILSAGLRAASEMLLGGRPQKRARGSRSVLSSPIAQRHHAGLETLRLGEFQPRRRPPVHE